MMKWIFTIMIAVSVLFGCLNGRINEVSNAALEGGSTAVTLVLSLTGALCLWSGVMKVAEEAKITDWIAQLLSPITRRIFPGLAKGSAALRAISMNITANLLGLGNAATPFGLEAMRCLQKNSPDGKTATDHMITFVVLNTASVQLIPTTVSVLRLNHGAAAPLDILPAVLLTSAVSLATALVTARLLSKIRLPGTGIPVKGTQQP